MNAAAGNKSGMQPVECAVSAHLSRRDVCFEGTVLCRGRSTDRRPPREVAIGWNLLGDENEAALRKAMRAALDLSCCRRM